MRNLLRVVVVCAVLAVAPAAWAAEDDVCQPQGEHISGGNQTSITVTAPEGQLISGYCVKAGSAQQGDGPEYVTLNPPVESVTITHSTGKEISHYIVFYTTPTPTTPPPTSEPPPTTEPPPTSDTPSEPTVEPTGGPNDGTGRSGDLANTGIPVGAIAGSAGVLAALGTVALAWARRRSTGEIG